MSYRIQLVHPEIATPDFDATITRATVWYDDHLRLWTLQWLNDSNDQIGLAEYSVLKRDLRRSIVQHEAAFGKLDKIFIGSKDCPPDF